MDFLPGALAGLSSVILGYPFDTLKTRMQVNNYGSSNSILKDIIKKEGITTLYRGLSLPLITNTTKRSYQYYLFDYLNNKDLNPYVSGALAGISGSIIGCPMHVLKANMQSTTKTKFKNIYSLIQFVYKKYGWKGFYKGFNINLFKDSLYGGFYLGNYVLLKEKLPKIVFNETYDKSNENQKKITHFFSGGLSAVFIWGIFIPIDHIETAIQTNRGIKYIKEKVKNNNILILWRGSFPILLRIFPVSAISMLIYELTLSYVKNQNI